MGRPKEITNYQAQYYHLIMVFKSKPLYIVILFLILYSRFGSFEIFKPADEISGRKGPSAGKKDMLEQMLNYTIGTFYPQVCYNTTT